MKKNIQDVVIDFEQIMTTLKVDLVTTIPNIINALIILLFGIMLAFVCKWLSKKIVKWIARIIPDSLIEKNFIKANLPYFLLGTGRVLFIIIIFFTISFSLKQLGLGMMSTWLHDIGTHLPNIVGALLVIILGWKAKDLIESSLNKTLSKTGTHNSEILSKLVSWSIFLICVLVSLQQVGLDVSLIITLSSVILGAISLGIALMFSLGAKDSISDILYCYQLNKFLKIGHTVNVQNYSGKVKSIGPVFVQLETEDGNITIPGKVFSREILSFSQNG